jgi:hypothetical protein
MARFIPGVLGTPIGKVENKVYRQMNGKTFVSHRPDSYNISQTKSAINSRQAFGQVVQFAKLITSSPELSHCWKKAKLKGTSAYHRIIKHNLPLTKDGLLSVNNQIIPNGFDCTLNCILTEELSILFNLDLTNSGIPKNSIGINVYNIISLKRASSKKLSSAFLVNTTSFTPPGKFNDIQFSIDFSNPEKKLISKYDSLILFTALVITDINKILKHSSSIAKTFSLR